MPNALERLKKLTVVVADTGDFNSLEAYQPRDATTNPTLILKAVRKPEYAKLLDDVMERHAKETTEQIADRLLVSFGRRILDIIPGRVSTEVDARLSFDTQATVAKAHHLIALYREAGIDTKRVLIKIASTWEGIQAARQLESEGIHCNLTLLFGFPQAVACAEAKVRLISPFVGRIYDWHRKRDNRDFEAMEDPGVQSVRRIYSYYKRFDYATEVMGASFRNVGQILALAGCDLLTISPDLLKELSGLDRKVERSLLRMDAQSSDERQSFDEKRFRFEMNEDAMATEKLSEGIRAFVADARALEQLIDERR